jgi:hypothetical protein
MASTLPIGFKAKTFRLNKSHQYADHLWLRSVSTVANSLSGATDSVTAAHLPEGDMAIPTVFGALSWAAPGASTGGECRIRVFDTSSHMVTAAAFTSEKASFSGMVEIGDRWQISVDPVSSNLVFKAAHPATGVYEIKHVITSV